MITLGLIGAGKWGKNFLKTALSAKNYQIKYVCSKHQNTLDTLPANYIKTTSSEDLLKSRLDGIIIASPASSHFKIAEKFLNNGFHLLIEKPLTTRYSQALKIQRIARKKKLKILVGHTYLYNPAFQKCAELLKNVGPVKSISFQGILSPKREDTSVIWDWGPHPVSMMLYLLNRPVQTVGAFKFADGSVKAELAFSDNILGFIDISWFGDKKIRKLVINGIRRKIIFNDAGKKNQKIAFFSEGRKVKYPKYSLQKSLERELLEFTGAVYKNEKIVSDVSLGVKVVKILAAMEKSAKLNGKKIVF